MKAALCLCGCGREVVQKSTGRPSYYYNGACRTRMHRRGEAVRKLPDTPKETVTKFSPLTRPVKPILKYPGGNWKLALMRLFGVMPTETISILTRLQDESINFHREIYKRGFL